VQVDARVLAVHLQWKATNINNLLSDFNNMSPKLKLTSELEESRRLIS